MLNGAATQLLAIVFSLEKLKKVIVKTRRNKERVLTNSGFFIEASSLLKTYYTKFSFFCGCAFDEKDKIKKG
jgi:hypothetical protein